MTVPRKAEVTRMVDALLAAGIAVGGVEFAPDGTFRVLSEASAKLPAPANEDSLEAWTARHAREG